jgi:putative peptidoglycan lipid II flippase
MRRIRVVSALTLVSRLAGFARDAALAHFLGAREVMSAFSTAFALPNVVRGLFGEGALSAAFIPVFTEYLESGQRKAAGRFFSVMVVLVVSVLSALALVAVGSFLLLRHLTAHVPRYHLLFGVAAVVFPFVVAVCLVALLQAALNACKHFVMPALAPVLLNLFIIAGAVAGGLWLTQDVVARVYVIAGSILAAGAAEVAIQVPALRRAGLRFRPVWDLAHPALARVLRMVGPMVLALGIVEVNAGIDKLIGYVLMRPEGGADGLHLGPWTVAWPMQTGAPAVLYYAQRLYWLPLGVFGIAIGTVIFPELSAYAARKDDAGMAHVASHALRLTLFIGLPAGAGLMLVADPFIRLFFNHGQFAQAPDAVARTAIVAIVYAAGLWAFSANHILVRAFYARQDTRTPLRIAALSAGVNIVLDLALVWPLAERGLALATVIAALVQLAGLAHFLGRRFGSLPWRAIASTAVRTVLAAAVMAAAAGAAMYLALPAAGLGGRMLGLAQLIVALVAGGAVFAAAAHLLRLEELRDVVARGRGGAGPPSTVSPP